MTSHSRLSILAALALGGMTLGGCGDEPAPSARSAEAPAREEAPIAAGALALGQKLPDFTLPDYFTGEEVTLSSYLDGESYVCVIWHSPACPCAHNCALAISSQLTEEQYPDLRIVGVTSDKFWDYDWFRSDLKQQVDDGVVTFPVLFDEDRKIMELYGAKRTPTVWLADKDGVIRFWGAPENTLVPGGDDYEFLLKDALDDLKAGRDVQTKTFMPIGCPIEVPEET